MNTSVTIGAIVPQVIIVIPTPILESTYSTKITHLSKYNSSIGLPVAIKNKFGVAFAIQGHLQRIKNHLIVCSLTINVYCIYIIVVTMPFLCCLRLYCFFETALTAFLGSSRMSAALRASRPEYRT